MKKPISTSRRDAWAVIRGFLYQVRSTVLRWIDLDKDTVLLCEWGEDIAYIRRGLDVSKGGDIEAYMLEQIKHRERHVTLRSPEVLRALADFLHHRRNESSGIFVRFRFTTTGAPGHEQDANFPGGLAGIEACRRITDGSADDNEVTQTLKVFRAMIEGAGSLQGSTEQSGRYAEFQRFVASASDQDLHKFIKSIDWAVGQPSVDVLRDQIERRLVSKGFVSPSKARGASERLTVYVLETLSQPGQKLLSRMALRDTLARPELSEPEQALLNRLASLEERLVTYLEEIGERLGQVQTAVSDMRTPVLEIHEHVIEILERLQAMAAPARLITQEVIPPFDEPPRPSRYHVQRERLLQELTEIRHDAAWIHLHAGAGLGKTHLSRDLCQHPPLGLMVWISLSGISDERGMMQHLGDQICVQLMKVTGDNTWWVAHRGGGVSATGMMESLVRALGGGTIVVIDDVPDLVINTKISARLQDQALACLDNGVTLLTTGQREIPPKSAAVLPPDRVKQVSVPPMNSSDVLSMLQIAGAPSQFLAPQLSELIAASTRGHPSLISAVVRWLEARRWVLDPKGWIDILTGAATADEQETETRRMVALIPDDNQREMLCRLSLIGRAFNRESADVVARAVPSLARPGELLNGLLGPWVNRLGSDKFEVSPLVATAGRLHLAHEMQQRVHAQLADSILAKQTLSIEDAFQAIIHTFAAERWFQLGAVLIQALASAKTSAQAKQVEVFRFMFPPSTWPKVMPPAMRIMIRAQQIRVVRIAGGDAEDLNQDLDALLQSVGDRQDEVGASVYALMFTGVLRRQAPPGERIRKAIQAVRLTREHPELFSTMPVGTDIEDFVWLAASHLKGVEDVEAFLNGLSTLEVGEFEAAFKSDIALQTSQIIADRCWVDMSVRPEREQDWNLVLATIAKLEDLAQKMSNESLRIIALRARAITLADYLERPNDALALIRNEPEPSNPDVLFLYSYTIARILEDNGELERAVSEYERAVATGGQEFSYFRFSAYASATEVAGRSGQWGRATRLARGGLSYAKSLNKAADLAPPSQGEDEDA